MRPVNLIPSEERRGEQAPLRSGPLAYVLLGVLVVVLAGVTALVLTGNQISEREGEIATLEAEDAAARARAERLAPYTQFRTLSEQRAATVSSLADSRFDWERVMRELSLILPSDVWLTGLAASVAPGIGIEGGGSSLRGSTSGPALELSGCANGQEGVAGFVTSLKDIEGVTRVGVSSSELGDANSGAGAAGGEGAGSSEDCRTRPSIAKFEIVVAFDAAPVPVTASAETTPATTESGESSSEETSEASTEETEG
jgi:Tfp pilus assembly protein PilN